MSQFKVGDVVEIVYAEPMGDWARPLVGRIGKIIRPCNRNFGCWDVEGALHAPSGRLCSWDERHLRKIDPPATPDAEPRADFTPADDDFKEWLRSRVKTPANAIYHVWPSSDSPLKRFTE